MKWFQWNKNHGNKRAASLVEQIEKLLRWKRWLNNGAHIFHTIIIKEGSKIVCILIKFQNYLLINFCYIFFHSLTLRVVCIRKSETHSKGYFVINKWLIILIKAQEIMMLCSRAIMTWPDGKALNENEMTRLHSSCFLHSHFDINAVFCVRRHFWFACPMKMRKNNVHFPSMKIVLARKVLSCNVM